MSINDEDDPLLKLHKSLNKEAIKEDSDDTVSISSDGEIAARTLGEMSATSLRDALQKLVKYAKILEEKGVDPDAIPQKMLDKVTEDDESDKD